MASSRVEYDGKKFADDARQVPMEGSLFFVMGQQTNERYDTTEDPEQNYNNVAPRPPVDVIT